MGEDHLSVEPVVVLLVGVSHDCVGDGARFVTGELEAASRAHLCVMHVHSEVLRKDEEP